MPWCKRSGGKVRGTASSQSGSFTEWLDADHPDVVEYQAYLEDQSNPTPERRAQRILASPKERVMFKALFKLENRMRALEGLTPVTAREYRDMAKASYFEEIS